MEIQEVFEEIKKRIDAACQIKDFSSFEISDLKFKKDKIDDGRLMHYIFTLEFSDVDKITIDFRCYDQSGPFQNLPDMNKFSAILVENNISVNSYQNTFED